MCIINNKSISVCVYTYIEQKREIKKKRKKIIITTRDDIVRTRCARTFGVYTRLCILSCALWAVCWRHKWLRGAYGAATVLLNSVACKRIRFRVTLRERRNSARNVSDVYNVMYKRKSRGVADKTLRWVAGGGGCFLFFSFIFPTAACGHVVRGPVDRKGAFE